MGHRTKFSLRGTSGIVASGADVFLDSALANSVPENMQKYFEPNIPEAILAGASMGLPDTKLKAMGFRTAWLVGRIYDYAWDS